MTPVSALAQDPMLAPAQPLGAARADYDDLGPISPELALVDPELAERARALLPEPREPRRPAAARLTSAVAPNLATLRVELSADSISPELALVDHMLAERARALLPEPPREPRRRPVESTRRRVRVADQPVSAPRYAARSRPRRLRRMAVLAGVIFVASAASGGYISVEPGTPLQITFEAHRGSRSAPTDVSKKPLAQALPGRPATSPRRVATSDHRRAARTHQRQPRHDVPAIWAQNVLGVSARSDGRGVGLTWQPPGSSDHVVVLRALGTRRRNDVVYRGRGTRYQDASARSCSVYRYTIVNYDARGRRSTGVPTSVVTEGCT